VNFIFEFGFDAKEGKSQDLQRWLSGNEEKLAAEAPEGCEYLGTYVAVTSSEKEAGNWRSMWRLASYGAQDDLSEAMKQGGTFRPPHGGVHLVHGPTQRRAPESDAAPARHQCGDLGRVRARRSSGGILGPPRSGGRTRTSDTAIMSRLLCP
jgi:hypothetical protein